MPQSTDKRIRDTEGVLLKLLEGTAGSSGEGFFRDLVRALAEVLDVRYALVGELLVNESPKVQTVAVFADNEPAPNFVYDLAGTPCEQVTRRGLCAYPNGVAAEFPDDQLLEEMSVESYLGVPLVENSGAIIGVLVVLDDVPMGVDSTTQSIFEIFAARAGAELERIRSERRRVEAEAALRQSHKMEAMGTLAGGIAHDFNNILGAVLGNAELAADDLPENHPAAESVSEVLCAARRGRNLVEQILTFSRRNDPDRVVLSMADVVADAMGMLRAILPAGIELRPRVAKDVPSVVADRGQLQQVLVNLCTNAWQAMDETGNRVIVDLRAETLDEKTASGRGLLPGVHARLEVSDNGSGMDTETLRQVFDPFFTTKEPGRGTGLGLAVVHGIIDDHRGVVEIDSQPGEGTRVVVYLPTTNAKPDQGTEFRRIEPFGADRHVLYVDDEVSLVRTANRALVRLGFRVSGFDDVNRALAFFRKQSFDFDVVISDYAMPETDGVTFLSRVLAERPDIPVILVSGNFSDDVGVAAQTAGIEELLHKPHTQADLVGALRRVLGETRIRSKR